MLHLFPLEHVSSEFKDDINDRNIIYNNETLTQQQREYVDNEVLEYYFMHLLFYDFIVPGIFHVYLTSMIKPNGFNFRNIVK